ncbi:MAG TPA: adenylate/guanylate cyclase domain-containing protein [Nocardioidaceae bacterium]|nr:adenylate/guanylate cyclase domain-containing protein [Nocardioidaceae bacterium]
MSACANCGFTEHPPGAQFCFKCGSALAAPKCRSCETELIPGARFCFKCGEDQEEPAPAASGPATAGPVAARRITTVLFGDLVGFTTLSESRDQEEMREMLSRFFDRCRQIVGRYGGTIEKFIGDAVMAVWGVPVAHEDDAERAVRAGMELTRMVADLGEDVGFPELAMRVGLVTGEVAVTIGAEQQGMVAGDAVNTASRVQSAAAPGEVWVDETTRLLTSAAVSYVDVGSHTLKGKAEPMPLWSARAIVASVGGASRADGLEAPFVGRDRQLRLVKEVYHSTAENRRGALLVVDGEPGVGKSRLGWEFFKYVDGLTQDTYWHQGRCLAYGEGVAFWALAEAVRLRLVRLAEREDDVEDIDAAELVNEGLAALTMTEEERSWVTPRVGALLGGASIGTFARDELFAAWVTFFERLSEGTEVVLLVDDAHHADDGLLAFVEYLLEAATFPCLVVLLTRPGLLERRPALATNRRAAVLHLPELEPQDMSALVNGLVSGLPDEVSAALVERAEGMPLYAVETVRSLIDRDLVIPRGGQYVLADPTLDLTAIGAPASLQTLIAARLDSLSAEQRMVVNEGSILGATFEIDALRVLCPGIDVDAAVLELIRLQMLTKDTNRLSVDYGRLKFVQSVVRQVAYSTLSRRDRKAGHLAAARYLESVVDPGAELDAIIAQHYLDAKAAMPSEPDVAELETAAIDLLVRAADRATSLGSPEEAAVHLRTTLEHTSDPWRRADVERRLARAFLDAGHHPEAMAHADTAVRAFDDLGDAVSAGRAVAISARAHSLAGEVNRAVELAEPRFTALYGQEGAEQAAMELGLALSWAQTAVGVDARETLDRRMRLADKLGDVGELADVLSGFSMHYSNTGAPMVAITYLEAAANLARSNELHSSLARSLVNLTAGRIPVDLAEAVELGREAATVSTRIGARTLILFAEANLALALWASGRWTELEELVGRTDAFQSNPLTGTIGYFVSALVASDRGLPAPPPFDTSAQQSDSAADVAWFEICDAVHSLIEGDLATAAELAETATMTLHAYSGLADDFVQLWSLACELALRVGDRDRADRLLRLVAEGEESPERAVRAHYARLSGLRAQLDPGRLLEVESHLRSAIELYEQWGSVPMRARAQAELGQWLQAQGPSEEADQLVSEARATLVELGATALVAELDAQLDGLLDATH